MVSPMNLVPIKHKAHNKRIASYFEILLWLKKGYAVTQLVEALRYKAEGRGFDSRWCHWNFSLT